MSLFESADVVLILNIMFEFLGVSGIKFGLLGSVMDKVIMVMVNGENLLNEIVDNFKDGDVNTKWLSFISIGWVVY